MYRAASLSGIAGTINRVPYFHNDSECIRKMKKEIEFIFPNFFAFIALKTAIHSDYTLFNFAQKRFFEDPNKLLNVSTTFLEITGRHLPSYRYFDKFKNDIWRMFSFSDELIIKSDEYASSIIKEDSHTFCVHTRRGDFVRSTKLLESRKEYVEPATQYAVSYIKKELNITKVNLILIGDDRKFLNALNFEIDVDSIHILKTESRGADMAFAVKYCDSFFLTASSSTFGWWIAYLSINHGYTFYNAQGYKTHDHISAEADLDLYPQDWIKLFLNKTDGKIYREDPLWKNV